MSEGGCSAVVSKRLQQELMSLMMSGDEGISAFPKDDNLFEWLGTIHGSDGTVYEGLEYKITLKFGPKYPNEPPQCKFTTRVFHPNVDAQSGNICLDILTADKWSAVLDVRALLVSLRSLLSEPNNDSPLNNQAALLWGKPEEFRRQVVALAAQQ